MSGGARTEHFGTSPKIGRKHGRGRAQKSLELIQAMHAIAEASQPITGRGVGYKLFTKGLIPSMSKRDMKPVYRLLKEAREEFLGNGSLMKLANLRRCPPGVIQPLSFVL
jgi:hypothetical protein